MVSADGRYTRLRRGLLAALLWAGLLLCALAVARYWDESRSLLQGMGGDIALLLAATLVSIWALAVASWQQVMRAYSDEPITAVVAARHLALLLLGKYLPGGVWGFVARLTDSAAQRQLGRMFAAGVAEQWLGLVSMTLLATLGMLAAWESHSAWLLAAVLIPAIAVATLALLHRCVHRIGSMLPSRLQQLQALSDTAWRRPLWWAAGLTLVQQVLILGVVAGVAAPAFALGIPASLAVASNYGLAVVAGVLVVFMPGGILVREAVFVALSSRWLQPAQAIALAAGLRLVFTAFDLSVGLLAGGLQMGRAWRE